MALKTSPPNEICHCTDDQHYNCSIDELEPVQTYNLNIFVNDESGITEVKIDNHQNRACKSHNANNHILICSETCTKIEYKSILYMNGHGCNVYLGGVASKSTSLFANDSYVLMTPYS